jgi:hypothetical protein
MATDIELINTNNPIKNGTTVTTCSFSGKYNTINTYVNNKPPIADIESKYDELFDDITYYILGS